MDLLSNRHDLSLLGAPYLRIIGFSYVFNMLSSIYVSAQRSVENGSFGMKLFGFSTVLNTVLNYLLIFGKLGFPAMGVAGAALATLLARIVEFLICVFCAVRSKNIPLAGAQISALVFDFSSVLMQKMTDREWNPVTKFSEFQQELAYVYSNRKKLARLTVSDLANVRNFSREYFTRSFSRISGVSPKQFLTDLLLNEVKRRLARDEISIKEISYTLGFSSEFYFSKFCRKHMGLSPKQYRDKYLGKRRVI
jgi:AraC-like DNA-binding protein